MAKEELGLRLLTLHLGKLLVIPCIKISFKLSVVTHTFNPRTLEVENFCELEASLNLHSDPKQLGPQSETLSQKSVR